MTKKQACARLAEIQEEMSKLQKEAVSISDKTGVPFTLYAVGASNAYCPQKFVDEY